MAVLVAPPSPSEPIVSTHLPRPHASPVRSLSPPTLSLLPSPLDDALPRYNYPSFIVNQQQPQKDFWSRLVAYDTIIQNCRLLLPITGAFWDIIDDTIARKINSSDSSRFAKICDRFSSREWGVTWFIITLIFFVLSGLVGIVAFKESTAQQMEDAKHFLPVPEAPGPSGAT